MLTRGDPAPWFTAPSTAQPQSQFSTRTGRYVVLSFIGSAALPTSRRLLDEVDQQHGRLEKAGACFCGVSSDRENERLGRVRLQWPGAICFWDFDLEIARLYGAIAQGATQPTTHSLILDPALRVITAVPMEQNGESHLERVLRILDQLPPLGAIKLFAPVLTLPFVFEPQLCEDLIKLYEREGGGEGGTIRDVDGQSVRVHDHSFKQRTDCTIMDSELLEAVHSRLRRRVFPEIKKAFQFTATQIERYIISCYDSESGGHFRPHRDDTNLGSAHRRFAVSLNLNTNDYEGGELVFREFGYGTYRAPAGGAIVFSCSLMHEVLPVTKGKRFAFLPFIYDEAAAVIREANLAKVSMNLR